MHKKIYIGNLPFTASDREVRELFSDFGHVEAVDLVTDRDTGRPRGFGFVEMSSGAEEAIEALNLKDRGGRILTVNEIRPRQTSDGRARRW
jgi:RNA recognition motif-containing protein